MDINLGAVFALCFLALLMLFALLCFLGTKTKAPFLVFAGDGLRFLCLQGLLGLAFVLCYVLFLKNGITLSLSRLGVAFIPFTVLAYFGVWRYGALSDAGASLLFPLGYCLFLLWRYFSSGDGLGAFSYVIFNPAFGFIGSQVKGALGSVSAVLPLICAIIGRGVAVKTIDKRGKI